MCTITLHNPGNPSSSNVLTTTYTGPIYFSQELDCDCSTPIGNNNVLTDFPATGWHAQQTLDLTGQACGSYTLSYSSAADPCAAGCTACNQVTIVVEPIPELDCSPAPIVTCKKTAPCDPADKTDIIQVLISESCFTLPASPNATDLYNLFASVSSGGPWSGTLTDADGCNDSPATSQDWEGAISGSGVAYLEDAGPDSILFDPCLVPSAGTYDIIFTVGNSEALFDVPCADCNDSITITFDVQDEPDIGTPSGGTFCGG